MQIIMRRIRLISWLLNNKGPVFLKQLEYIVGKQHFDSAMRKYYQQWRFKHPKDRDLLRIFEKESKMVLDWYHQYFVNTTKLIEYKISSIEEGSNGTIINIERDGGIPMPLDIKITYADESTSYHTIPLGMMRNAKVQDGDQTYLVEPDWVWTNPSYQLLIKPMDKRVKVVEIDPSLRLADFDLSNNRKEAP